MGGKVEFVADDDECLGCVEMGEDGVCLFLRGCGVEEPKDDGGSLDGLEGALDAYLLYAVGGEADACCVDESEHDSVDVYAVFDGVSCGAVDVGDNGSLFSEELVEECGLACIGASDDGYGYAGLDGLAGLEAVGKMGDVAVDVACEGEE